MLLFLWVKTASKASNGGNPRIGKAEGEMPSGITVTEYNFFHVKLEKSVLGSESSLKKQIWRDWIKKIENTDTKRKKCKVSFVFPPPPHLTSATTDFFCCLMGKCWEWYQKCVLLPPFPRSSPQPISVKLDKHYVSFFYLLDYLNSFFSTHLHKYKDD